MIRKLTFSFRQFQHDTANVQIAFDSQSLFDLQVGDHDP